MLFNKKFNTKIKRLSVVIISSIIILLFFFLYYKINKKYNIGIKCLFHQITGLYCPGCGITRALFSLIELDVLSAIKYNLLIVIILPTFLYYYLIKIYDWINFKSNNNYVFSNRTWYILLIITIAFGVLRNINFFSFLAPTK